MPKPTSLQIQLTRFTPSGEPRYTVTKIVLGQTCKQWKDCNSASVNAIQTVFLENMDRAAEDTAFYSGKRALRDPKLDAFVNNLSMWEVFA